MDPLSQIRKIKFFIPPPESPLLTTYSRSLLPKVNPLKQKYQIFSNRRSYPSRESDPETVLMKSSEIDIINNLYRKIKRSRGQSVCEKETSYIKDPLYKSIYNLKRQGLKIKQRQIDNKKQVSFTKF